MVLPVLAAALAGYGSHLGVKFIDELGEKTIIDPAIDRITGKKKKKEQQQQQTYAPPGGRIGPMGSGSRAQGASFAPPPAPAADASAADATYGNPDAQRAMAQAII